MSRTRSVGQASAEQAVMRALKTRPRVSAAEVASAAGVGRSTASKTLARLEGAGGVQRIEGGREGRRRMPDRWMIADAKPAASTGKRRVAKPGGMLSVCVPASSTGWCWRI
jgi:DNA-binding transcriptional ArsR family regulator